MMESSIELTEQHVTCCDECPLYNRSGYEDTWCNHPEADQSLEIGLAELKAAPDWCPLRVRPLLIKLATP